MYPLPKKNILRWTRCIIVALLVTLMWSSGPVEVVYAQLIVKDPVSAAFETKKAVKKEAEEVKTHIGKLMLATGLSGLMNAASFFTRKMAYDLAKFASSGGKGQEALIYSEGFGPYIKGVADSAVGEIIHEFSQLTGLNLCQIPDPQLNLFLTIGIRNIHAKNAPTASGCSWTSFRTAWSADAFQERFDRYHAQLDSRFRTKTLDQFLTEEFLRTNVVEQNDFGVALGGIVQVDRHIVKAREAAQLNRLEGQGFQYVGDLISGNIRTPAAIVAEETKGATAREMSNRSALQIAGIYGSATLEIFPQAASVFLNTLTSDLLTKLLTEGLVSPKGLGIDPTNEFAGPGSNRRAAEQAFNFLFTNVPGRQLNAYDNQLINQFATCPETPGVYNCVIDTNFQQILDRARIGQPMTIREAMEARPPLLNPNWPLIPPDRPQDNQDKNCYLGKFCYSNVQKLRKARILPLGFEIATTLGDPDNPSTVTLGDVVRGYNDCAIVDGNERRTPEFPYCHLIDPNWIIKMPEAICEAEVFSPILVSSQASDRQTECADLATCVAYNSDGQCISYGYCLQEENTWNMPGQSCPAEYATCRSYVQQSNGAAVSYLNRTVDFGMCGPDNVGCLAYSMIKDATGSWVRSGATSATLPIQTGPDTLNELKKNNKLNQAVHINSRINSPQFTCSPSDAGCTQFRVANIVLNGNTLVSAEPANVEDIALKKAPDYLTCYDRDRDITNGIQWPTTIAEAIASYNSNPVCENYAPGCVAEEVGCKLWDPVNGGVSVPGKIGNNSCDPKCVGYDTFRQRETVFEPGIDPMYFIPSMGTTCQAQYEGCSEFTNIEAVAQGGEQLAYFTELRHCELPNGQNQKTFYSWEGSETEGFVLRVHQLAQYTSTDSDLSYYQSRFAAEPNLLAELFAVGAPKYAARTIVGLRALYTSCNESTYNLRIADPFAEDAAGVACRELYDDAGNKFYREIDQIVSVSNACIDFRKTETILSVDFDLQAEGQDICVARGGFWQDGTCNVCRGGGIYRDGACIYSTIVAESRSCPATQNQCRSYVGNTGQNIRRFALGTFESNTTEEWVGGTVSTESPFANQYSLRIAGSATKSLPADLLRTGTTDAAYEIKFWARGVPQQIAVSIGSESFGQVAIGGVWREYTLGPIAASNLDTSIVNTIQISGTGGTTAQFFVDNIELIRTSAYTYLIKNSWQTVETINGSPVRLDVPLVCDATPGDAFPGEALGCSLYQNANNPQESPQAVTSFESLCREAAIGCTAVYNTYNTVSGGAEAEREHWYNARCVRGTNLDIIIPDGSTKPIITEVNGTCIVYSYPREIQAATSPVELGICVIRPGDDHCYIERIVVPEERFVYDGVGGINNQYTRYYDNLVSPSTYIAAADTPVDAPIFISNQRQYQCRDVGCTELGRQLQTLADPNNPASYEFNTVHVRLTPENFTNTAGGRQPILCTSDGIGCDAFASTGNVQYFKDPKVTGNSMCEYRSNVRVNNETRSGWFQMGVGVCTGTSNICSTDSNCTGDSTCNMNEPVPCYTGFVTIDNEYGIWSNNTPNRYQGFVGVCQPQFNGCTEFIDRAATSRTSPDGNAYYVIANNQLTARVSECQGQVGLKDGCVLFDQTDNPNKLYNTTATYAASESKQGDQYGLVDPITTGDAADINANIILKVDRDRQCAEWLECRLSRPEVNENGQTVDVCIMYDVCLKADASGGCAIWSDDTKGRGYCSADVTMMCSVTADCAGRGSCVFPNTVTIDSYANRDTSWYGRDYSGYSILNMQSYTKLEPIVFDIDPINQYLAYVMTDDLFEEIGRPEVGCSIRRESSVELQSCGLSNEGVCYLGKCIAPVTGRMSNIPEATDVTGVNSEIRDGRFTREDRLHPDNRAAYEAVANSLVGSTCKAPPEIDAPYPATILATVPASIKQFASAYARIAYELPGVGNRKSGFIRANVYQDPFSVAGFMAALRTISTFNDVNPYISSCLYTKVTYSSGVTDYIPINQSRSEGICMQGETEKIGNPCMINTDCGDELTGSCALTREVQTYIGVDGFCLQKDLSRPINGGADFACLVWLPMQLSASRIDVYNNAVEAGYYPVPEYDAPTVPEVGSGGRLFCTESTDVASGNIVSNNFSVAMPGDATWSNAILNKTSFDQLVINTKQRNNTPPPGAEMTGLCVKNGTPFSVVIPYNACRSHFDCSIFTPFGRCSNNSSVSCTDSTQCIGGTCNKPSYSCAQVEFYDDDADDDEFSEEPDEGEDPNVPFTITLRLGSSNIQELVISQEDYFNAFPIISQYQGTKCTTAFLSNTTKGPLLACSIGSSGAGNRSWRQASERSACWDGKNHERIDTRRGIYQELVCNGTDGSDEFVDHYNGLYTLVQAWALDPVVFPPIGTGHVLRVEHAIDRNSNTSERSTGWGKIDNAAFALFPQEGIGTASKSVSYRTQSNLGPKSVGFGPADNNRELVFHTGLEEVLREHMLQKVYIVPLRIVGGHHGNSDNHPGGSDYESGIPPVLAKNFFIDFTVSDTEVSNVRVKGSRSFSSQKTGGVNKPEKEYRSLEFPGVSSEDIATNVSFVQTSNLPQGVHRRYHGIYINKDITYTHNDININDPLTTFNPCEMGKIFFAVSMDFDNTGKFLGYNTSYCLGIHKAVGRVINKSVGLQVAIVAELQDICVEFTQIYQETNMFGANPTNKAWTNKVWQNANNVFAVPGTPPILLTQGAQPYGSLPLLESRFNRDYPAHVFNNSNSLRWSNGGTPWRCGSRIGVFANFGSGISSGERCNGLTGPTAPLQRFGGEGGKTLLKNYFELIFGVYTITTPSDSNTAINTALDDDSSVVRSNLRAPQILATNPVTCKTRSSGSIAGSIATETLSPGPAVQTECGPGPANTFTINGMTGDTTIDFDGDDIPDESQNGGGQWDGLIGYGSYPISLQFFAFADHDRMPIRKVKVNFGDGSRTIGDNMAYFKNAKPYCAASIGECGNTQLTCRTDIDCTNAGLTGTNAECGVPAVNFGNQARACTQNFFEYNYVYRCYDDREGPNKVQVGGIENATIRDRILRFPNITEGSYVCAYRPRVQVTDNWGWCNGSDLNPITGALDVPVAGGRFGRTCEDPTGSAWTPYAQTVYVVPRVQ
jgi:hypothetical protein